MKPFDIGVIKASKCEAACNPMAWIIRQRTTTWYTHAVTFKNDQGDIWSAEPGGIKDRNISHYSGREVVVMRYRGQLDYDRLLEWQLKTQAECEGYDWAALVGFLLGVREMTDPKRWYCAEDCFYLFQWNGYRLANKDLAFVYPSFFIISPLFEEVGRL